MMKELVMLTHVYPLGPKTDDGLAIYSEAELRLDSKGGGKRAYVFL